jgi:hypothetical protein
MVMSTIVWALERVDARAARRVWQTDLTTWVGWLEAPNIALRDSAVFAVGELAARAWAAIADRRPLDPRRAVGADTVLAAVRALAQRLSDPDSALREHAVSAVLDVAEGQHDVWRRPLMSAATAGRQPLRAIVRSTAGDVLRAAGPRQDGVRLAVLEVLATVDAPPDVAPFVAEIATQDASSAVRALATAVALPALAGDVEQRAALLRATLGDASADVRGAVLNALEHDVTLLCADAALRRQLETLRRDGDAAVRQAAASLLSDVVTGRACR